MCKYITLPVIIVRITKYIRNSLYLIRRKKSIIHAIRYPVAKINKLSGKEKKKAKNAIIEGVTLK